MLYLPRGTVHQAVAQSADSVHLTISTYQRWTHGELATKVLDVACTSSDTATALPMGLRKGLPWNFLQIHSLESGQETAGGSGTVHCN